MVCKYVLSHFIGGFSNDGTSLGNLKSPVSLCLVEISIVTWSWTSFTNGVKHHCSQWSQILKKAKLRRALLSCCIWCSQSPSLYLTHPDHQLCLSLCFLRPSPLAGTFGMVELELPPSCFSWLMASRGASLATCCSPPSSLDVLVWARLWLSTLWQD